MSLLILFISAFGAATFLPFYSELVFIVLLQQGEPQHWVWLVATLGNTLGSAVNWILGRHFHSFHSRSWFPFKEQQLQKGSVWFEKYGKWSLLFAWLPVIGDAFTFIAGLMRLNFFSFIILTGLGKGARYAFLLAAFFGLVA